MRMLCARPIYISGLTLPLECGNFVFCLVTEPGKVWSIKRGISGCLMPNFSCVHPLNPPRRWYTAQVDNKKNLCRWTHTFVTPCTRHAHTHSSLIPHDCASWDLFPMSVTHFFVTLNPDICLTSTYSCIQAFNTYMSHHVTLPCDLTHAMHIDVHHICTCICPS